MDKSNIYSIMLLIFLLLMTAILALMLVKNAKNQEFKERTLIVVDDTNESYMAQFTICQWKKTKIEVEICLYDQNGIKQECFLEYPGYGDFKFKDEEFIDLLDALKIQPGETIRKKMQDLGPDILEQFGYLLEKEGEEGSGGGGGGGGGVFDG
jgi:hypothetical protein